MFRVRRIRPGEGSLLRALRLTALADAPGDATTTLARAQAREMAHWDDAAAANASGPLQATFVAEPDGGDGQSDSEGAVSVGGGVGMVGAYANSDGTVNLVGLWSAPGYRDIGVATALIAAARDWARSNERSLVRLWVVERNEHARGFYVEQGFRATGASMPFEPDPRISQLEMVLAL